MSSSEPQYKVGDTVRFSYGGEVEGVIQEISDIGWSAQVKVTRLITTGWTHYNIGQTYTQWVEDLIPVKE